PSPTQTVITSENFKTILRWHYPHMSETPHFTVEILPYDLGKYKVISTCVNISAHSCDLSGEIHGPFMSHWVQVKAVIGSQQSEYAKTEEFIWQKHGKIGPPKLSLTRHGDKITVDIYHPAFPPVELLHWIEEVYYHLIYLVTFADTKNQTRVFNADNCSMYKCSIDIPIPTYCVSAQGSLYEHVVRGTRSEESCIHVPLKQTLSTQYVIILCVLILILSLTLTVCCACKKLRKKNLKLPLPKSLVSVIRNLNTDSILESKSEGKYISVVSFMPSQSSLPVNVEVTSLEAEQNEETIRPENCSEGASSVLLPEAPAEAEEVSVQVSTEEVSSNDEQNHKGKESYFISHSNQMDVCSNSSGPEVSAKDIQQTVIPSSCLKFSGYDKPHVPLDMLIDIGEEQPVIAYRLTD
ncbi:PREDICTED: interferon gamma receptor 1, partial [Merops nubicus]|uniref:interferon gamma receptor 1 n=1 Tax=Merops nubicus TaxID=57421 RepID=UPI0004F01A04